MNLIIDSSVAVKWFSDEPGHDLAKQIILIGDRLIAPDWAYAEVANSLWRKARGGELNIEQVKAALAELPNYLEFRSSSESLMQSAFDLAQILEHSIYDCVFLAMTLQIENSSLVTDDSKFAEKIATKGFGDKLRRLGDAPTRLAFQESELEELLRLYDISKDTIAYVTERVSKPFGDSGLRIHSHVDLRPAFDSPAYVRLKESIANLTSKQAAVFLALAWLGRGYSGNDFDRLYQQAATLASQPSSHAPYIISQIGYLDRGIAIYDARNRADN